MGRWLVNAHPLPRMLFSESSTPLGALRVRLYKTRSSQANPDPQTIFRAFTQQNRMSSPPNTTKTNNPNPINKIKLSPKWFLVMVNLVQLNQRAKKAPATRRGFFVS